MDEWPLPGRDYNNSRDTQDSPIDSSNVSQLVEAWRVELPGLSAQFGKCSTAPLILGGVVYLEEYMEHSQSHRARERARQVERGELLTDMPPCGSRMPPTAALSADEIDRVRTWIANGAADD